MTLPNDRGSALTTAREYVPSTIRSCKPHPKKIVFLFGPRTTGKSFLIRQQLQKEIPVINLLNGRVYDEFHYKPYEIDSILAHYPGQIALMINI